MLDIKLIRQQPEMVKQAIRDKRIELDLDELLRIDAEQRRLRTELDELQRQRNQTQSAVKSADPQTRAELIQRGRELAAKSDETRAKLAGVDTQVRELMLLVPQIPAADAPRGASDADNVEVKRWGTPRPKEPWLRDHVDLLKLHGWAELDRIAQVAGSRSYALRSWGAVLEMSVLRYAVDKLMAKGFTPMAVPSFVVEDALVGSGQFPTGRGEAYWIEDAKKYLSGTSEVSLNYLHSGEILNEASLPILYCGLSTCFRKEAGSAGRDVRGLVRVHQFQKIEQYVLCKNDPEESARWHAALLSTAEELLQAFEIPYRVVACCTGDMGPGKVRQNDVESWIPSEGRYRETHSCSTLHDWQARRADLRYRDSNGEVKFGHTLNNTAVATPRLLVPLLENHQREDGSIAIPAPLRPYLGSREVLP
jgi:seryl-tRNA synthetase